MSTYQDLQSEIAQRRQQIEEQRQAALEAERQRKAAEEAPQRAVQAAEQELKQLEYQAMEAGWSEFRDLYLSALDDMRLKAEASLEAVARADFRTARDRMSEVLRARGQADHYRQQAAEMVNRWRREIWEGAWNQRVDGRAGVVELSQGAEKDRALRSFDQRHNLTEPPAPYQYIHNWVVAQPEGLERQYRRGLSFAAFGMFGDDLDSIFARYYGLPRYLVP
jgi:hypothetical protein